MSVEIKFCKGESLGGKCCYPDKSCDLNCEVIVSTASLMSEDMFKSLENSPIFKAAKSNESDDFDEDNKVMTEEEKLQHFKDWWDTLRSQYKTPEIIFSHIQRYFTPKQQSLNVLSDEEIEMMAYNFDKSKATHYKREYSTEEFYTTYNEAFVEGFKAALQHKW